MVTEQAPRQSRPLAAFDFDGSLTVRDSFGRFLRWRAGEARWAAGLVAMVPAFVAYGLDRDRGRLKAAAVRVFLRGASVESVTRDAEAFADVHRERFFRPDALEAWARHGREGDLRVIVTASPELTVRPFAERLGADRLIGTRLALDAQGRIAGALQGENCRGEEKVRRLRDLLGADVRLVAAYGDTSGDREMLAMAERPGYRVFTARP